MTEIKLQSDSVEKLLVAYKNLVEKTDAIYLEAPTTTDKAVNRASEALKIKKDNSFTDDEIDS
ncbi:MAG: hypothetical protein Q4A76_10085, partial [Porphyromonadaceae bacterium]|nr:hypothetical protein [Porphyromonadaceae bacterium]